jgi:hypothetical protein
MSKQMRKCGFYGVHMSPRWQQGPSRWQRGPPLRRGHVDSMESTCPHGGDLGGGGDMWKCGNLTQVSKIFA